MSEVKNLGSSKLLLLPQCPIFVRLFDLADFFKLANFLDTSNRPTIPLSTACHGDNLVGSRMMVY